jgi:uncharacterized membrane protein required for colicin V production
VDIGSVIQSFKAVDLLVFFAFFALFILGYMQGIIRRLLGIASILVTLLFAAQLRQPVGDFLAQNWTQYTPAYDHMIAFGSIFLAGTIGSTIALQLFFKPVPLFAKYPVVDEIIGGLLGLLLGAILLAAFYLITDPVFTIDTAAKANEFPIIRPVWDALQGTITADVARHQLVPTVLFFFGGIFPNEVTKVFPR